MTYKSIIYKIGWVLSCICVNNSVSAIRVHYTIVPVRVVRVVGFYERRNAKRSIRIKLTCVASSHEAEEHLAGTVLITVSVSIGISRIVCEVDALAIHTIPREPHVKSIFASVNHFWISGSTAME
jgi:hypothetical protein